jgi:hypothetical protein
VIEIKVDVKDLMTGELKKIKQELLKVPSQGLNEYQKLTPIQSGNARRNTYLANNTIRVDYPYAQRLDEGYSKQAPKGMTLPWEAWFRNRIKKIMGK